MSGHPDLITSLIHPSPSKVHLTVDNSSQMWALCSMQATLSCKKSSKKVQVEDGTKALASPACPPWQNCPGRVTAGFLGGLGGGGAWEQPVTAGGFVLFTLWAQGSCESVQRLGKGPERAAGTPR